MRYNYLYQQSRFATEKGATLAPLIATLRESSIGENAMFYPPKQPSIETRFNIGLLGFLMPIGMMMFAHILNIKIDDGIRDVLTTISTSFMGMIFMESMVMLWNIFFVQKLIPIEPYEPIQIKTAPSFNPNKTYPVYKSRQINTHGYVYLLAGIHDPTLFKIGRTNNPDNRLKTFNVKLPFEVEYICTIKTDDMFKLERELHFKFASKRLNGEWFKLTSEDVEYIKGLSND